MWNASRKSSTNIENGTFDHYVGNIILHAKNNHYIVHSSVNGNLKEKFQKFEM